MQDNSEPGGQNGRPSQTNRRSEWKYHRRNIDNSKGVAVGHAASATVTEGISGADLAKVFQPILQKVAELPEGPSKSIAQQAVTGLEQEVKKGDAAEEKNVSTWFNFLAQAAPDVWDVAVATLANPIAGVAKLIQLA